MSKKSESLVPTNSKSKERKALLISFDELIKLADKISQTVIIKNNDWLIQVKAIRQHYLFEDDNSLSEIKSMGKAAIEVSKRKEGRNATIVQLFSITYNSEENSFLCVNENHDRKKLEVTKDDPEILAKVVQFILK